MSTATSLSTLLAQIETAAERCRRLESELTAERQNMQMLAAQYREKSGDALKALGIVGAAKERKPRSTTQVLISTVNRSVRKSIAAGEKNPKAILVAAIAAAEKTASSKLKLDTIPADVRSQLEERVKNLTAPKK